MTYGQPVVQVSAEARLEARIDASTNSERFIATLRDDLGSPLEGREVTVRIERGSETVRPADPWRTAADGTIDFELPASATTQRIVVLFSGDALHGSARAEVVREHARAPVLLTFLEPASAVVPLDTTTLKVVVLARSTAGASAIAIELLDENERTIATGSTDAEGVLRSNIPSSALGAPGPGTLIAHGRPDEHRAAATTHLSIVRTRATSLELSIDSSDEAAIELSGSLRAADVGIDGAAIGLFANDEHLATVLTDANGRYEHTAQRESRVAAYGSRLQARFESSAPWLGSSRSAVHQIALRPRTWPSLLFLVPPLLCAGWLLLRRRRAERNLDIARAAQAPSSIALASRARGTSEPRARVSGIVRDGWSGRPIADACVALNAASEHVTRTGSDGRFEHTDLPAGPATLRVEALGFVPIHAQLSLPHHGEWDGVDARLESVRRAVMRAYRPAAMRVVPSPDLADMLTIRETRELASTQARVGETWNELTVAVEHAAYAAPVPSITELQRVERLAARAQACEPPPEDAPER